MNSIGRTSPGDGAARHPPLIVGREHERLLLDTLISAVARHGAALVLRGGPGMGRTALLDYASRQAQAQAQVQVQAPGRAQIQVVRVSGVESETALAFAALADLLAPFRDQLDELPDPQRAALEVCLAVADGPPVNPYAVCAGTLRLLAASGSVRPVVVLVDDLQWIDPPSQQVLLFVARRLSVERVAMVMAVRTTGQDDPQPTGVPFVEIGGLPEDACARLLDGIGIQASEQVVRELARWSGGNPLAIVETAATLDPAQLRGETAIGELPVGRVLERAWSARLDRLPDRTLEALAVVAASLSTSTGAVEAALKALNLGMFDLEDGHADGLVTTTDETVQFCHPVLRPIVLGRVPLSVRLRVFRALAESSTGDLIVWYRAAATFGPDEAVAQALALAAAEARRRGGFGSSAQAWQRAAGLTPDRHRRAQRLLQAAIDAHVAGQPHDAATWCDQAYGLTGDPLLRADVALVRGRVLTSIGDLARAGDQLVRAARAVRELDPARACALLAEATVPVVMDAKAGTALRYADECAALAERVRGPSMRIWSMRISLFLGYVRTISGQVVQGRQLLDQAAGELAANAVEDGQHMVALAGTCRVWLEDDARARELLTQVVDGARQYGAPAELGYALVARSDLHWWAGSWAAARVDATEASRWAQDLHQPAVAGVSQAHLARIEAACGNWAACERHVEAARRESGPFKIGCFPFYTSGVLGLAALGRGRHELAVDHLEHVCALATEGEVANPNVVPFAADLAEAHIRTGDLERAAEVLDRLEGQARVTGLAWPAAAAARCRGLMATSLSAAEAWFGEAQAAHGRRDMPFEYARTLLVRGEVLRRSRHPAGAREPLTTALAIFRSLGAVPWAARASAELAATGLRPAESTASALDRLTPQELQVARAVADGMSNSEAAAALYVSRKTVEAHLTRIYRKLDVRSRTELTRVVARSTSDAS